MIAVLHKNSLESSKRIINSWSRSKRRWRIISKSREQHSHASISSPMTSSFKFYHKLVILMQSSPISENVLIISIGLSSLTLRSQDRSSPWHQLSLKPCLKLSASQQVSSRKVQSKTGLWKFKKWWSNHSMIPPSKPCRSIPMKIHSIDRNGCSPIMLKLFSLSIRSNGAKVLLKQF